MTSPSTCNPDVSIVIVSYNTAELTARCIQSILGMQTRLTVEIIVVDNASPDDSAGYLAVRFPQVNVIEAGGNHGFAYANNLGFARSRGEFVLCLNPDTEISAAAVEAAIACLRSATDIAMVGVRLRDGSGAEGTSAMRFPKPGHFLLTALLPWPLVQRLPLLGDLRYGTRDVRDAFPCDAVVGCFMLFPRWLLDRVGGFDDRFFMYGEEVEWCWRIRRAGYGVQYLGSHSILHLGGASTRLMSGWKLRTMARGQILAQTLMRGSAAGKATNAFMILGQLVRLPIWLMLVPLRGSEPLRGQWARLAFLCRSLMEPSSALYRSSAAQPPQAGAGAGA